MNLPLSPWRRRPAAAVGALVCVIGLTVGTAGPAGAEPTTTTTGIIDTIGTGPGDNRAVAVNEADGSSVFELAFSVKRIVDGAVTNTNAAIAVASCTDCQTVAIAFQIVLVLGQPDVVAPQNVAVAVNVECTSCDTMATAYQFVIGGSGPVRLTKEGRKALLDIRKRLKALEGSGLTGAQIQTEVEAMAAEVRHVLQTQLVPVGRDEEAGDADEADGAGGAGSTTTPPPGTATTGGARVGSTTTTAPAAGTSTTSTSSPATGSSTTSTSVRSATSSTTAPTSSSTTVAP